jgi:hypothetical protein
MKYITLGSILCAIFVSCLCAQDKVADAQDILYLLENLKKQTQQMSTLEVEYSYEVVPGKQCVEYNQGTSYLRAIKTGTRVYEKAIIPENIIKWVSHKLDIKLLTDLYRYRADYTQEKSGEPGITQSYFFDGDDYMRISSDTKKAELLTGDVFNIPFYTDFFVSFPTLVSSVKSRLVDPFRPTILQIFEKALKDGHLSLKIIDGKKSLHAKIPIKLEGREQQHFENFYAVFENSKSMHLSKTIFFRSWLENGKEIFPPEQRWLSFNFFDYQSYGGLSMPKVIKVSVYGQLSAVSTSLTKDKQEQLEKIVGSKNYNDILHACDYVITLKSAKSVSSVSQKDFRPIPEKECDSIYSFSLDQSADYKKYLESK